MKMHETQDYNIALLPSVKVGRVAMAASAKLSQPPETTLFSLMEQAIPHTTITMARFLVADQAMILQVLHDVARTTEPIAMDAERYGGGDRFINVTYARTPALTQLQQKVLRVVNTLRSGLPPEQSSQLQTTIDSESRRNLETFGFQAIGDRWSPHLTLTRFQEQPARDNVNLAVLPPLSDFNDISSELALCTLGEHGTATEVVAKFMLSV